MHALYDVHTPCTMLRTRALFPIENPLIRLAGWLAFLFGMHNLRQCSINAHVSRTVIKTIRISKRL